jgi:putative sugar O-methyltransferase
MSSRSVESVQSEIKDSSLLAMLTALRGAADIYKLSPFWERLAIEHVRQLEVEGFENFKRHVNLSYFSWGIFGIIAHQILPLAWWWLKSGHGNPAAARLVGDGAGTRLFGSLGARIYALHVALLYQRVLSQDREGLFERCREAPIGNPIREQVKPGVVVTQDICNSIHEYIRSSPFIDRSRTSTRVLEIGAGYGRLAATFLDASPGIKYWIVDIPPALYVSQRYLSEAYPAKKIFAFKPFARFADVEAEVDQSDICFFMSNQIEMLPDKTVDLSICISNLHEMTKEQIAHYFKQIDRMTRGTFYNKQWMRSITKENGFTISREEYPVPADWVQKFNRRHPIQSWFFEAAYEIP